MTIIDNHTHLHDSRIIGQIDTILAESAESGVHYFANNGTCEEDWPKVASLSDLHHGIIPCFGLHPWYISTRSSRWLDVLAQYLASYKSAVGEIGLDHTIQCSDFADQEDILRSQMGLAKDLNLPFVIHCRKAWDRLLKVLNRYKPFPRAFLVHNFNGSNDIARRLLGFGAYLSASTAIVRRNHETLLNIFAELPLDRLLIETDSPEMSIDKSVLNAPSQVVKVLELLAISRKMSAVELESQLWQNAITFWGETLVSRIRYNNDN